MRFKDWLEDLLHWSAGRLWLKRVASVAGVALSVMTTVHHFDVNQQDADHPPDDTSAADDGGNRAPASVDEAAVAQQAPIARPAALMKLPRARQDSVNPPTQAPVAVPAGTMTGMGYGSSVQGQGSEGYSPQSGMQVGRTYENSASQATVHCDEGGVCEVEASPDSQWSTNGGQPVPTGYSGTPTESGTGVVSGGGGGSATTTTTSSNDTFLGSGPSVTFLGNSNSNGGISTGSVTSGDDPLMEEDE